MGGDQEKVINAIWNQTNNSTYQCANINVGVPQQRCTHESDSAIVRF